MPIALSPSEPASRRDAIIDATIRVIGRKGLAGASIRAIAHEMGLSIGVVTHHFVDKAALLCAALESCFQPWKAMVEQAQTIESPLEQLRFVMLTSLGDERHPPAQMQVWLGMLSQIDLDDGVAAAYRTQYRQTRQDIVSILDACQREQLIDAALDTEDEAARLLSLADGLLVSNTGEPGYYSEERIKRIMAQQIDALISPRQEEQLDACRLEHLAHTPAFVAAEVVDDDDAAWFQYWDQELFDPSGEGLAIDRAVEHAWGDDAVVPQPGDKCQRFPVPVRHLVDQRLALCVPAMGAGHVGLGPGFINEDHALGVYPALDPVPAIAAADDIGTVLLFGKERLFLNVLPQRLTNRHSVSQQTTTPRSSRSCASSSCSVRSFFCSIRATSQSRSASSKTGLPPPILLAATDPVARLRCAHLTAVLALTPTTCPADRADMPSSR